jgi:hypothetical protein
MARYPELKDGEWYRPPRRGFCEQCCSCGLVHRWDFRIKDGAIEFRVFRDERRTAAARRARKKKVVIVDE